jgi:hypothetical protein
VNLATSLEVDPDCPPVSVNNSAFLPYASAVFTGIREYFVSDTTSLKDSDVVSAAIPRLMQGTPIKMAVCPSESTLLVQTSDDLTRLYIYRWATHNRDRVQAAWGIWTLTKNVMSFDVLGNTLWMIVARGEGPCIESMELEPWNQTEEAPVPDPAGPQVRYRCGSDAWSRWLP